MTKKMRYSLEVRERAVRILAQKVAVLEAEVEACSPENEKTPHAR